MSAALSPAELTAGSSALRQSAGVWEPAAWGVLRAEGKDRLGFLHKYLTQDVKGLAPGQGAEACALTVKGGTVAHLVLLAREQEALLLVAASARDALLQHLTKYVLFDDVRLREAGGELAALALHGPRAAELLGSHLGLTPPAAPLQHVSAGDVLVVRQDLGRLPGFALIAPPSRLQQLRTGLLAAGATAVPPEAAEMVRIEEGVPVFGVDLDERTIPIEAGLTERAISTTKGCYTGQEVIARILHRGHVNRRVAGFRFPAQVAPEPGPLFAGEKEVARVTSAATSPRLGGIGLGLLHVKHADGATLAFGAPDGPPVTVAPLPFPA